MKRIFANFTPLNNAERKEKGSPKWLELNWLLSLFSPSRGSVAKNYLDFVEKVDIAHLENPAKDISGGFILGGVELGKYFGNICGAAITVRYKRFSEQISRNRRLKGRVNRVKNRIVTNGWPLCFTTAIPPFAAGTHRPGELPTGKVQDQKGLPAGFVCSDKRVPAVKGPEYQIHEGPGLIRAFFCDAFKFPPCWFRKQRARSLILNYRYHTF